LGCRHLVVPGTNLDHIKMWARPGVKHPGTWEPLIGFRDILMFSMLINLLLLLLLVKFCSESLGVSVKTLILTLRCKCVSMYVV
jgi:hypothetical protein